FRQAVDAVGVQHVAQVSAFDIDRLVQLSRGGCRRSQQQERGYMTGDIHLLRDKGMEEMRWFTGRVAT
ncbi:MAG: hypothetical protein K2J05_04765, partial [Muribaculaceae bacterium]|nr:hypothetical protein [Muribaculaceae bacterium]